MKAEPPAAGPAALLLEVQHDTHYTYSAPVSLAHHLAHLQPLQDEHQTLLAFDLDIEPQPGRPAVDRPAQAAVGGPGQRFFSLVQPHRLLRVRAHSRVRVQPRFEGLQPAASAAWDDWAARLRYSPGAPYQREVEFSYPSPYVPRLQALRSYAEPSFPAGLPLVQAALDLMRRIHAEFSYEADSTSIDTPLTEVLEHRHGVCQDFAHLMIGALRMLGLPARYVSGYLLTEPPEGGPALVGADATHAWVQLWCPGTPGVPATGPAAGWLDLDPTNDRVPGAGHVRLAIGRDYGDVTPLRGVIRGGGRHSMEVGVHTRVLAAV
jgi:transglutaminase-like putative cysteine protease